MPGANALPPRSTPSEPLIPVYGDQLTFNQIRKMEEEGGKEFRRLLLRASCNLGKKEEEKDTGKKTVGKNQ